jgi:hypothetical protein
MPTKGRPITLPGIPPIAPVLVVAAIAFAVFLMAR